MNLTRWVYHFLIQLDCELVSKVYILLIPLIVVTKNLSRDLWRNLEVGCAVFFFLLVFPSVRVRVSTVFKGAAILHVR